MKASNLAKLLTTVFLAGAMVFTAEAAFSKVKTYNGSFSDVAKDAWYAKEVASGYECGIQIENFNDIKEGDILEVYVMEEIKK